jgi:diguanylate cyclase (GGDEF)-like protein
VLRSWDGLGASAAHHGTSAADWRPGIEADQEVGRRDQWHDPITGLPRPCSFLEHLERALARPGRPAGSVAVFLIAVPDFGVLKAQVGEAGADELLRTIAERLHEEVPEPNLVTRLRGSEFVVALHGLGSEVTSEALATRLLERACEPCQVDDRVLTCRVIGALAFAGDSQDSAMALLDRGIRALGRASLQMGRPEGIERSRRRVNHLGHQSPQSSYAGAESARPRI